MFDLLAKDNASPAFRSVGNEAETAGKKTSAFGSLTSKAMGAAAGAVAGIGIASVLGNAVKAASDLNETVNKTNVIFGENAREVREWASDSARNFGLSEQAALNAASGFGNMLTQLGFTADAAMDASTGTVQLAADLGSFNNLDTEDVLERIGAAMRGEYDSLQLLIPNINAARVEQEALAMSGKSVASELTAAEKASATLAIVQRDGAAAAGDFARTSDGLANSQKILNAEWQDAQARLGELLVGPMTGLVKLLTNAVIPLFETTVGVVGGAVELFTDLPGPVQLAVAAFGLLALARGPLSSLFDTVALKALYLKDSVAAAATGTGKLRAAMSTLGGAFTPATVGITAAVALLPSVIEGFQSMAGASQEAEAAQGSFADALRETNGVLDENSRKAAQNALVEADLVDVFNDAGISATDAIDGLLGNAAAQDRVNAALQDYITASGPVQGGTNKQAEAARLARNAYEVLAGTLGLTREEMEFFAAEAEAAASGSIPLLGGALAAAGEMGTAAAVASGAAADAMLETLQSASEGFIEPLSVYKELLADKEAADRHYAEVAAEATTDATDSWEDHVSDVSVSLAEYATALEDQILAQENWQTNLSTIAQRGGTEVAAILAEMGVEGAEQTALMANATEEDFQRMRTALLREAQLAGDAVTGSWAKDMQALELIGRDGSARTVQEVARQLGVGVGVVRDIARRYGIELASGVNPILRGLGKPGIDISGAINSGGGRADGGYIAGPGGPTDDTAGLFALSNGEYVIRAASVAKYGKSFMDDLNIGRLATGGFVSTSDVPKPPSLSPYQSPISPPAQATNERAYGDTVDWLEANLAPALGPNVGGYQAMFAAVKAAFPYVQLHSGFRPGSITATGNLSYHASGRAIDITPDMSIFNWLASSYPNSRELIFSPANGRQIWNGRPHMYSEPTRGDHFDHVHWAMANGGIIREPVLGVGQRTGQSYSFGERGPETVVPWDMSGGRGVGGGGAVTVQPPEVKVYLDGREWRGIARVEAEGVVVSRDRRQGINTRGWQ